MILIYNGVVVTGGGPLVPSAALASHGSGHSSGLPGVGYVVIGDDGRIEAVCECCPSPSSGSGSSDLYGKYAELLEKPGGAVDAKGGYIMPGAIDDQVHFREPGMTYKAEIATESRAALIGGITSYMEMPNTSPATITLDRLEDKYSRAAQVSAVNYSFYLGATNNNIDQIERLDPHTVCGVKVFMGSSTGDMLVDEQQMLENIFAHSPVLVATHCEQEEIVRANLAAYRAKYGDAGMDITMHPLVRSAEACYVCSARAVELAHRFNTRLHVLHLSTGRELSLFEDRALSADKLVTNEVCVHHLWFSDADYALRGNLIKWNPAIKSAADRAALRAGVCSDLVDVVATDHAPHTLEEKLQPYLQAPSGGPLVEHSLVAMLEMFEPQVVVRKMANNPAVLYNVEGRGFLKVGYFADVVVVMANTDDTDAGTDSSGLSSQFGVVTRGKVASKCGWSPFEGVRFRHKVVHVFVNGEWALRDGVVDASVRGRRLLFSR